MDRSKTALMETPPRLLKGNERQLVRRQIRGRLGMGLYCH